MKRILYFSIVISSLFGGLTCGEKTDPRYDDMDIGHATHIKPILEGSCISCHGSGVAGADRNGAVESVNLDTYGAAKAAGPSANTEIQADRMPPNAPLSAEEKDLFQQWVDDGMPE